MAEIAVSVLLKKLATLMGDEYKKLKGLRKEVSFLMRELCDMNALLQKMDDADKLDPQAKNWRKDIIEMSYDIEDYIDDFMGHVGEASDNVGALRKFTDYLRTFKHRHRLANQFREIKTLVMEAGKRRRRYMLDQCIPSTTCVIVDPRLSALYQKSESLVGIDSQKEVIVRWVMDEVQQLKVMSIIGIGGLGKTTLANEVSREVSMKFSCKAFISISQNPDITKLLNSLLSQLGLKPYSYTCELQDPINRIIAHLQDRRYFIIIDDLWDIRAWNTISCAFPQSNRCSRVLITTRIETVARASCGNNGFIHYMKPLSKQNSRKLFFDRIYESEDACPPDFIEVSCKILKKCGGLPLAITSVASMIACQPTRSKGQWAEYIQNSLDAEFASNPTYEDVIHILDFSYKNLPHPLKACFMYLGTYPEDHMIYRVDLERRWVAEGFISSSSGLDVWDVAKSYFNELVNRSMIQPVYGNFGDIGFEVKCCRVHDMMLDLILRKCKEDNFISRIGDPGMMLEGQNKAVRRLTINLRRGSGDGIMVTSNTRHLSHVRSLNIFRGKCMVSSLEVFKFMRLLFLDIPFHEMDLDLSGINHLSQLRYLKVIANPCRKILLPSQICLRLLETLDLCDTSCCDIANFVDVPRLTHVYMSSLEVRLPDKINNVKSLVTLDGFNLALSSLESIMGLSELTALSRLVLGCETFSGNIDMPLLKLKIDALITSLEKLDSLRHIEFLPTKAVYCRDDMQGSSFSPHFRKIEGFVSPPFIFFRVPIWIGHLRCLRYLDFGAKHIHQEDFNIIQSNLTSLVYLWLEILCVPTERIVIGGTTAGFKILTAFSFICDGVSCLTFEVGAMPKLQKLQLMMNPLNWDADAATPIGLEHLPSLKNILVFAKMARQDSFEERMEKRAKHDLMMSMFEEVAEALPTHPAVKRGYAIRPEMVTL